MRFHIPSDHRIFIVTGHYGSGKTEFALSLAMMLGKHNDTGFSRLAVCDLDIVNPYFRSRERGDMLKDVGVTVYGGLFGTGSTAEIPELDASVRAPLEDSDCFSILDAGGNDSGARVLNQFSKYFTRENRFTAAVINSSRPDTSDVSGALGHIRAIEREIGLPVDGLVSNTHMLTETKPEHILRGYELCKRIRDASNKPLLCCCYPEKLVSESELSGIDVPLMPIGMYMRQSWLDK